ncbi:hypothetical protein JCM8547_006904 [Rhodosporidiobolus lusitaniae]
MQLPHSLVLLISLLSVTQVVHSRPAPHRSAPRDINISHKSLATGTTTTHSIDASVLPAEIARELEGSDININLTTDRVKRAPQPASGINNSTINLTVIGSAKQKRASVGRGAQHHNIHIDASSSGSGSVGGIHNSTVNINLNSASKKRQIRRKVNLGNHSVLVDVSSASASSTETDTSSSSGIEDSTVHVNILPPRALQKSTGHHSIVVDSSSLGAAEAAQSSTTTGANSAVVDTSSSSSSSGNSTSTSSSGVKNSTINLTVISPKDEPASSSSTTTTDDAVEAPIPSLARLSKRSTAAFEAWSNAIQRKDLSSASDEEKCDKTAVTPDPEAPLVVVAEASQPSGFVVVRRNHHSKPSVLAKRA